MDERSSSLWRWVGGLLLMALLVLIMVAIFNNDAIMPLAGRAVGIPVVAPDPEPAVDPQASSRLVVAPDLLPEFNGVDNQMIPVAAVAAAPGRFHGQEAAGLALVGSTDPAVPQTRGLWLEQDGQRLFMVFAREPREDEATEIQPDDWLRLTGVIQPGSMAAQLTGLDERARQMLSGQPALLLVDPAHVAVVVER